VACSPYDGRMAKLTGISPVLLVADLERSVAYYRERLGFHCEVYGDPPNFATADRDAPHGFREFGVQDPDGHDIAFGQRIAP
jgi:predicted GNAT superfamily acetyltransferase